MKENPNPLYNAKDVHDQPAEKTNADFNGKSPEPKDPNLPITKPDKEPPPITAEYEEMTDDDEEVEEGEYVPNSRRADDEPTYLDIIDE